LNDPGNQIGIGSMKLSIHPAPDDVPQDVSMQIAVNRNHRVKSVFRRFSHFPDVYLDAIQQEQENRHTGFSIALFFHI
jgi:hypothetical protein